MKKTILSSLAVTLCSLTFSLTNGSLIILGTEDKEDRAARLTSIEKSNDECLNFMGTLKSSPQKECEYIQDIVTAISTRKNPVHRIDIRHVDMQGSEFNLFVNTLMRQVNNFTIAVSSTQKDILSDNVVSNLRANGIDIQAE